jgi:hypothetical protein
MGLLRDCAIIAVATYSFSILTYISTGITNSTIGANTYEQPTI